MFLDRQRRLRRRLSGEKNAAFGEAVRNCIDTPNREMVFLRGKDSEAVILCKWLRCFFTVFLSAPPDRPPPCRGGGRPGGDKTFRGGLTLLLMTSKQRRSRRCSYGRTASLIKTSFSQRHGSSCRSTSALSEVDAGNAALSGRSHKLAAPPAEVTRVYDHIIRLPMRPFVKDGVRKTCRKKEKKKNAEM